MRPTRAEALAMWLTSGATGRDGQPEPSRRGASGTTLDPVSGPLEWDLAAR